MSDYDPVTGTISSPGHAPSSQPLEDRIEALEKQVADLIAELHRHISLRLGDTLAPPSAKPE